MANCHFSKGGFWSSPLNLTNFLNTIRIKYLKLNFRQTKIGKIDGILIWSHYFANRYSVRQTLGIGLVSVRDFVMSLLPKRVIKEV